MPAPNATMLIQTSLTLFATLMEANYSIFPDGDGVPHLININYDPLTPKEIDILEADIKSVVFTLYTRRKPLGGEVITIDDPRSLHHSDWNRNKSTIVTTHGWRSTGNTPACTIIRDANLGLSDCNVIVTDWRKIAENVQYQTVAKSVPRVTEHVASFVNFLRLIGGLDTKELDMVGHCLGAHVSSLAARIVKQSSLVAKVVALDPAGPMFEDNGPDGRVDRSHADYVQVVHTNAGKLGMSKAVGTTDYYVNGGHSQPGCDSDWFGICAQGRSYLYYAASLGHRRALLGTVISDRVKVYKRGPVLDP